ncbi:MAG TPA: MarR family winged helix-turn-helix transcriptional regulator [Cellulomonas sp.]
MAGGSGRRATPRESSDAWESLFRTQVELLRRFRRDDVWHELSLDEYDVLYTLASSPGHSARIRDLQDHSLLTQPSLSRMVERLETGGLVRRGPVAGDRRGVAVTLTDEGLRLQRLVGGRHVRSIDRVVGEALDAGELATLRELLERLRARARGIPS